MSTTMSSGDHNDRNDDGLDGARGVLFGVLLGGMVWWGIFALVF